LTKAVLVLDGLEVLKKLRLKTKKF